MVREYKISKLMRATNDSLFEFLSVNYRNKITYLGEIGDVDLLVEMSIKFMLRSNHET